MRFISLFFCAALLCFRLADAGACCGLGNANVAAGHQTIDKSIFLLSSGPDLSIADNPARRQIFAPVLIAYGITDRLSVGIQSSYAWMHSEWVRPAVINNGTVLLPESTVVFDNNSFGDGLVSVQYSILAMTVLNKRELNAGLDVGIPWGQDRKFKDGVILPVDVQTGSGAYSLGGFVAFQKFFPAQKAGGSVAAGGRIKFTNRREENPGDEASATISLFTGPHWITRESIAFNYRLSGPTIDQNGTAKQTTSGSRVDCIPAVSLEWTEFLSSIIEFRIPLWRDSFQKQYGSKFGIRAALQWEIDAPW